MFLIVMFIFIQALGTTQRELAICITKDGSIKYDKPNQNARIKDEATGKMVDYFLFCSKSNTTESTCKYNSSFDYRYMITLDQLSKY